MSELANNLVIENKNITIISKIFFIIFFKFGVLVSPNGIIDSLKNILSSGFISLSHSNFSYIQQMPSNNHFYIDTLNYNIQLG